MSIGGGIVLGILAVIAAKFFSPPEEIIEDHHQDVESKKNSAILQVTA